MEEKREEEGGGRGEGRGGRRGRGGKGREEEGGGEGEERGRRIRCEGEKHWHFPSTRHHFRSISSNSLSVLHSAGGKRITGRKEEVQAMQWVSWTSVLGPEVNGIWPKYSQVNDVNATDTLFEHQVIATGDDFGLVKLFRFPCVKKGEEGSVCVRW